MDQDGLAARSILLRLHTLEDADDLEYDRRRDAGMARMEISLMILS